MTDTEGMQSGYVSVHGLEMYYETEGDGPPLVLLHGGISTIATSFGKLRPLLARGRKTIAIEQQAHGHTADIDRPLTFEQMADDTAALLGRLGIAKADFVGYSDGGNVAFAVAMRHPELVGKVVVAGTNFNNEGLQPAILKRLQTGASQSKDEAAKGSPPEFQEAYLSVAPHPGDWSALVSKVMKQAAGFDGWSAESIGSMQAPVLVIVGDADMIRPEHAVAMFQLLPNSQLAILPGTDHMTLMESTELLMPIIAAFLGARVVGTRSHPIQSPTE